MKITLTAQSPRHLTNLCGVMNENINLIKKRLGIEIYHHGEVFDLSGKNSQIAKKALEILYQKARHQNLNTNQVELQLNNMLADHNQKPILIKTPKKTIEVRSHNQQIYVNYIDNKACTFSIGPAGTGKTYLAVAKAVAALDKTQVDRIILVRPAVEAGEKLGFLPGDLSEKVDPYLRPIYDVLYLTFGTEHTNKLIERNVIEVAPLAFMRGRTLDNAFIILDEAQNTTSEQMKMFLTRLGFGSKMVITGDISQIDLPKSVLSGLKEAIKILKNESEIGFAYLDANDVMRHHLVNRIVRAYENQSL